MWIYTLLEKGGPYPETARLLRLNADVYACLSRYKDAITSLSEVPTGKKQRLSWDELKKFSNDHELLFTSLLKYPCVARLTPPSRSYFKLWETLQELEPLLALPAAGTLRTAHVAEGPGGFVEALVDWIQRYRPTVALEMHGMTLQSEGTADRLVPQWRLSRAKQRYIRIHTGADGTGNLYRLENIDAFVAAATAAGPVDVFTADGGFDICGRYDQQEIMVQRLLAAEIYTGLRCRARVLFFKVFDTFSDVTLQLLYLCAAFYERLLVVKPLSSRPANSEKYILAVGLRPGPEATDSRLETLRAFIDERGFLDWDVPAAFLAAMTDCNIQYAFRQIHHIVKTLVLADVFRDNAELMYDILMKQYDACRTWCVKYHVPYKSYVIQLPALPLTGPPATVCDDVASD